MLLSHLTIVIIFCLQQQEYDKGGSATAGMQSEEKGQAKGQKCVGLQHFPAHRINISHVYKNYKTKSEYFEQYLNGSMSITHGRQTNKDTDLCLAAANGAKLLPAEHITQAGYSFVVYVGDSIAREAAWSMRRLAGSNVDQCQPWPKGHVDNTKADPSFACADPSESLSCSGGGTRPINGIPQNCCEQPFVLFR